MKIRYVSLLLLFAGSLVPSASQAQWHLNGTVISAEPGYQVEQAAIPDGNGGAIIVWSDSRDAAADHDLYVQKINGQGVAQWTAGGVPVCMEAYDQSRPAILSDGLGGAVVAWIDYRSGHGGDIYAQRIDADGSPRWTANGVPISAAEGYQTNHKMTPDGFGGTIIIWEDYRSGNPDIYAMSIDGNGATRWAGNGVAICSGDWDQIRPGIVADGSGGAIVAWEDWRNGANTDIFAQRISAAGAVQWIPNGLAVTTATGDQGSLVCVPDGAGGAIVAWEDFRTSTPAVYTQRVNVSGAGQWTSGGTPVCAVASAKTRPALAPDGQGGAFLVWEDFRSNSDYEIYGQRMGSGGQYLWTSSGTRVCYPQGSQYYPGIVADDAGGAFVNWADFRSGNADIYVQRIDDYGVCLWNAYGVPVCQADGEQANPAVVTGSGGGMILAWADPRGGNRDLYAQRIEGRYGHWGWPEPILTAARDNPGDQGGRIALNWAASPLDIPGHFDIYRYTVWRAMDEMDSGFKSGPGQCLLVDRPVMGRAEIDDHVIWHEKGAVDYYWELVGAQVAYGNAGYSFLATTRLDSTSTNAATHYFRVAAEGYDAFENWPSNVLRGCSVDNLAPAAPLLLTATRNGDEVTLTWNRVDAPDLRGYSVYRAASAGVEPLPANFLAAATDTMLIDTAPLSGPLYYVVAAEDIHENRGLASNEASVSGVSDVVVTPGIRNLVLAPNHPNPVATSTRLQFGLPATADVEIEVYDVAGRRVRAAHLSRQDAGWQRFDFDGRNDAGQDLPSGVYFYRVHANGATATAKMVIVR